ncbi:MAG: stage III sporulation protein AD [Oscillospiraceae bacterium]|nr:stage III sporulation protein AD [Oscillospiraceae bacterium]
MKIVSIAGICIVASIMCKFFESTGKEYALYIKIAAAAVVMSMTILFVSPIAESIRNIYSRAGSEPEYLTILFKALGICYITQFACDICKDSGENALATQTELAGKVSLLIIALPLFESLTNIVENLI